MSTAAEKRFYAAKLAATFTGKNAIREAEAIRTGKFNNKGKEIIIENFGEQLESFLRPLGNVWPKHEPWCAAYVSAIAFYTDRDINSGPKTKYRSSGSDWQGAGIFSENYEDAFVGLAVSWGVNKKGSGHVGIVVDVDRVKKIVLVSEGNTGSSLERGQSRNGTQSSLKTYTLDKNNARKGLNWLKNPNGDRPFRFYAKIWEEDDYSIRGSHTPKPVMLASNDYDQYSSPKSDNQTRGATSTTQNNQNTKQAAQQDYSNLFLFSSGNIMNVGEQQELSKPITQTSDSKKSEGAIPIDKQNISLT